MLAVLEMHNILKSTTVTLMSLHKYQIVLTLIMDI